MKIAFTLVPSSAAGITSQLIVSDLDLSDGTPKLINKKTVLKRKDKTCLLEAQDFYDKDIKMTYFCYVPNGTFEVMGINLQTRQVTNFSNHPNAFNEPEGIFPGGPYTTIEADRQCEWLGGQHGSSNLDIWKLKLDGKDFVRLTNFNDYQGSKASNPVASTDGKFMSFQFA